MPHCQDPDKREFTQLLELSLAYRKINWEHGIAGTSGSDDWRSQSKHSYRYIFQYRILDNYKSKRRVEFISNKINSSFCFSQIS